MTEVLEKLRKSLLEDIDYEEKIRILNLNKRIEWFVDNKHIMSQNEKWDAFYDIVEDYDIDKDVLIKRINNVIRKRGLSV
jgi:hypothetical protein